MSKLAATVAQVFKRLAVSLIAGSILSAYFFVFYHNFYKRKMYDEMWQAMANHYQGLPEDRLAVGELNPKYRTYWDELNINSRHFCTVNGVRINTMFQVKKYDSKSLVTEPGNLLECIEVSGKYKPKNRIFLDAKETAAILKEYKIKSRDFDSVPYPDLLDEARDPESVAGTKLAREQQKTLEHAKQKVQSVDKQIEEGQALKDQERIRNKDEPLRPEERRKERKMIYDFAKAGIAQKNAIYYPFFINLPLDLRTTNEESIIDPNNPSGLIKRSWFYFEVEIVKRLGLQTSLVIGLVSNPYGSKTDLSEVSEKFLAENNEVNPPINPETYGPKLNNPKETDRFFKSPDKRSELGQPEWINNHLLNNSREPPRLVNKDTYYLNDWKKIIPGELENSIGFDISNGKVKVSGGLTYVVDMREFLDKVQYPDSIYQTMRKKGNMEQEENEERKRRDNVDDEGYQFVGDSFGIAYNPGTGRWFLIPRPHLLDLQRNGRQSAILQGHHHVQQGSD